MSCHFPVVIIADDLTGALDSAVPFALSGIHALVHTSMDKLDFAVSAPVVAINTNTRTSLPEVAASHVCAVSYSYKNHLVFKKIDSTLRGNFTAELVALLKVTGARRVVIAPAHPAMQRMTRNGIQWVYDRPVHTLYQVNNGQSDQKNMSHIPSILQEATGSGVSAYSSAALLNDPYILAATISHDPNSWLVFDAETQDDLRQIARAALLTEEAMILCGSGGLAAAVAALLSNTETSHYSVRPFTIPDAPLLLVAGTYNPVTRGQIAHLHTSYPDLMILTSSVDALLQGTVSATVQLASQELAEGRSVVLTIHNENIRPGVAQPLVSALADMTSILYQQNRIGGLLLTGGDAAQAVCEALNVHYIRPAIEPVSGMPLSFVEGGPANGLAVITKAGGFGNPSTLTQVFSMWFASAGRSPIF